MQYNQEKEGKNLASGANGALTLPFHNSKQAFTMSIKSTKLL
jgi:hypothetical protein